MKYMILSDIHGSVTRLRRALDIYRRQKCDYLRRYSELRTA